MAYSSVTELRDNVPRLTVAVMPDADVETRIAQADNALTIALSNIVDFGLVVDTPAGAPTYINKLSQYKTAELSLVAKFSAKRMNVQITDWEYWKNMYDSLLEDILEGAVDLEDVGLAGMLFNDDARENVTPALGMGEEGEFLNNDDIESQRAKYGKSDQ